MWVSRAQLLTGRAKREVIVASSSSLYCRFTDNGNFAAIVLLMRCHHVNEGLESHCSHCQWMCRHKAKLFLTLNTINPRNETNENTETLNATYLLLRFNLDLKSMPLCRVPMKLFSPGAKTVQSIFGRWLVILHFDEAYCPCTAAGDPIFSPTHPSWHLTAKIISADFIIASVGWCLFSGRSCWKTVFEEDSAA